MVIEKAGRPAAVRVANDTGRGDRDNCCGCARGGHSDGCAGGDDMGGRNQTEAGNGDGDNDEEGAHIDCVGEGELGQGGLHPYCLA